MRTSDFDYDLPPELIAQYPAERRDASRLMHVRRETPEFGHHRFADLPELLQPGDVLVVNDTRVLAARVEARRSTGGAVELLFIAPVPDGSGDWRALVRPAKRVRSGEELRVGSDTVRVVAELEGGERRLAVDSELDVPAWLERRGTMPLPPYIRPEQDQARVALDRDRYQTVYAREPGAVAAPTAGLHFTTALLEQLRQAGIDIRFLTLDVGPGTFRPVAAERIEEHRMDGEAYRIPGATAAAVNEAKRAGRRIVAVGTTAVRALEHAATTGPILAESAAIADIYITPGFEFRIVDAMITNLHLPRSTPILLAAAMVGRERLLAAYAEAIERGYRFYSYGDAMLLQ